ncbi:MAG TPA: ABC transporter ATP-binding protein, partial [Exiguobacterium sp.]|nr:ABC transporter ATP-binding protein [Exiguobacterium sp.]
MEVTIQQVNKRFGSKQVLSDIDVSIASGQCVA